MILCREASLCLHSCSEKLRATVFVYELWAEQMVQAFFCRDFICISEPQSFQLCVLGDENQFVWENGMLKCSVYSRCIC